GRLVHAVHRAARQAQPTYEALCATVRGSPVVTPDETGWKVGGHPPRSAHGCRKSRRAGWSSISQRQPMSERRCFSVSTIFLGNCRSCSSPSSGA
ncbi:MAG: transposase, partial [Acidobacteria bacterium]|nr:transposase [Acidobacteriota bacterium]